MKPTIILFCAGIMSINACGQKTQDNQIKTQTSKTKQMNLDKITNSNVKKAIEALQSGDKSWYSYFTENPTMTDDGNKIDFKNFFSGALGHEKFISIDKIENDGKDIYGNFEAGKWGTFKTFFKFHENADGKFDKLEIGQAKY